MSYLYQVLTQRVDAWRSENYPCDAFPAIREILEFATEDGETGQLRYLRRAQFRALETYWYLRLVRETPRIPELYAKLFPSKKNRREAMGLTHPEIVAFIADVDLETCLERVKTDTPSFASTPWRACASRRRARAQARPGAGALRVTGAASRRDGGRENDRHVGRGAVGHLRGVSLMLT